MFAYCSNNPILFRDDDGQVPTIIIPLKFIPSIIIPAIVAASRKPLKKATKSFINSIREGVTELVNGISGYFERVSEAKAEKRVARAREAAAEKLMIELKTLPENMCAIIYIEGMTPKVYKTMHVREVVRAIAIDLMAGTNETIPPKVKNWGIFTASRVDAEVIFYVLFGKPDEELSWSGHSPLPHFHTVPHTIEINGVLTTPHAWFLY